MLEIPGPLVFTLFGALCFLLASYKIGNMSDSIDIKVGRAVSQKSREIENLTAETKALKSMLDDMEDSITTAINALSQQEADLRAKLDSLKKDIEAEAKKTTRDIKKPIQRQGSKCLNKISTEEEKIEQKFIEVQGKIKRQLPVVNERLNALEERVNELEEAK